MPNFHCMAAILNPFQIRCHPGKTSGSSMHLSQTCKLMRAMLEALAQMGGAHETEKIEQPPPGRGQPNFSKPDAHSRSKRPARLFPQARSTAGLVRIFGRPS